MQFTLLILWIVCITSVPAPIEAQPIETTLRAGEHPDFTRLVISLPEGVEWRLQKEPAYVDLLFPKSKPRIDLSRTFERIPRSRLRAVEQIENGLRLLLNCACSIEKVNGIAGQLVLDIRSPQSPEQAVETAVRPLARPDKLQRHDVAQNAGTRLAKVIRGKGNNPSSRAFSLASEFAPMVEYTSKNQPIASTNDGHEKERTEDLLAAISNAIANDLLSLDKAFEPAPAGLEITISDTAMHHIGMLSSDTSNPVLRSEGQCESSVFSFMADWTADLDWEIQREKFSKLYDPVDRLNSTAAESLLHEMLGLGLGAEARAILSLMPETGYSDNIHNLTYLLDLEVPPDPDALTRYAECSDIDALWAFMSKPGESLGIPSLKNRIIRAAQSLSPKLRNHIGPTVIQHLLRHGASDVAKLVQSLLDRTQSDKVLTVKPAVLMATPDAVARLGREQFLDLSDRDFLVMLENAQRRDLTLPANVLSHAIDRQFVLRRSDFGRSFSESTVKALAKGGQFNAAFRIANSGETGLNEKQRTALLSNVFETLAQSASDTVFVTSVFAQEPWSNAALPQKTRTDIGSRLATLGFTDTVALLETTARESGARDLTADESVGGTARNPAQADQQERSAPEEMASSSTSTNVPLVTATTEPSGPQSRKATLMQPASLSETEQRIAPRTDRNTASQEMQQGLLAQGRQSLESSEALRAQLQDLIGTSSATILQDQQP